MTTPTKEQIEKIKKKIIKDRIKLLKSCGYTPIEIGRRIEVSDVEDDIKVAITEWEKIRNKKQNACTKKSCWNYCGSNSDGCFLPESYQHRPTCFVSHKKARELMADWEAKREDK